MEDTEFKITRKRKSNRAEIKEPVSVDLNKNVENIEKDKQEEANKLKISNEEESPKNDIPVYNTDNFNTENSLNTTEQRNYWGAIFGNPFKSYFQAVNKDLPENNFDISKWDKKFNFGAFISPIFWIAWNWNFWLGILFYIIICIIIGIMEDYIFSFTSPIIGMIIFIVFGFLMGFNGNRLAYKTRPYRDLTHFEKNQKMWSWLLGILVIAPFILLYSFNFLGDSIFFNFLKQNDNYNNYITSYNYTETETKQEAEPQKSKLDPNIKYTEIVLDKQVLYQLGYNPADKKNFTSVKIPYTYEFKGNHYKINKIGEKAFYNYGALQNITIEEGVQILGVSAFENCTALTTVNLPNSITKINNNAFANCKSLRNINLPKGLMELRDSIFFNCISLKTIEIPSNCTKISDMVFYKCKSLKEITIPEKVTSIGQSAFAGCRGLEYLEIPSSVKKIGQWAFSNCVSISYLTVPDNVSFIGEEAFANVGYVYYDGNANGQPWGALDSNKLPEVPYTLEEMFLWNNKGNIRKIFGEATKSEKFYFSNNKYQYIPGTWYGDSLLVYWSNDIGNPDVVSILCCSRNGFKTNAEIQVGDSENKLIEVYSGLLSKVKNGYYYIVGDSEPDYSFYIYFQIKNERISKIYISRYFDPYSESDIFAKLYKAVAKAEGLN